jgi:uncharacterized membrane protein YcaP (DUF421 family)
MEIVLRSAAVFVFLWFLMRIIGKKELAEISAFELVLLVVIGDLVQQGVTQEDMSVIGAMMAVGTIAFWALVFAFLTFRFKKTRPVLEGLPVVIIKDGEVLEQFLHAERMTLDELKEEARNQGIADLATVKVGVLEPDGKVSFLQENGPGDQQSGSVSGATAH